MKRQRTYPALTVDPNIRLGAMNYSCQHLTLEGGFECDDVKKEQSLRPTT